MKQTIRIIGGLYRGKKIHFPSIDGLRPTPDRVRETVFNWLMHDIRGARCMDAFAGSGALGFEAHSRGARHVVFIEQSRDAYHALQKQIMAFQSDTLCLINDDAFHYLQYAKTQFDIVFFDPPYAKNLLPEGIRILEQSTVLAEGGLLYIEADHEPTLHPNIWEKIKLKHAGQIVFGLYRKKTQLSLTSSHAPVPI